jgi:hypothetical protein
MSTTLSSLSEQTTHSGREQIKQVWALVVLAEPIDPERAEPINPERAEPIEPERRKASFRTVARSLGISVVSSIRSLMER